MKNKSYVIRLSVFLSFFVFFSLHLYGQAALSFDGTDDYVSAAGVMTNTDNFTMEAWVTTRGVTGWSWAMAMGTSQIGLGLSSTRELTYLINNSTRSVNTAIIPTDTWTHIALVRRNGTYELYMNGSPLTTPAHEAPTGNSGDLSLSRSTGEVWKGNIDEVRVWTVARTASEIASNYNKTLIGAQTGLAAYYKIDDGTPGGTNTSVTQLADASGNSRNATLFNFTLTGSISNFVTGANISQSTLTLTGTLNAFTTCSGTASTSQQVSVSGSSLFGNITVSAPDGFAVSADNSSFSGSVSLSHSGGSVSATTIYVRLTGASAGSFSGNITAASSGATTRELAVSGIVTAASVGGSVKW